GVINFFGAISLTNCTLAGNLAFGAGGGLKTDTPANSNTVNNTIIAGNHLGDPNSKDDALGAFNGSCNLVGVDVGLTGLSNGADGNQVGTIGNPLDAGLAPLGTNGGPTQTHALHAFSPAVDAGRDDLAVDADGAP